MSTPSRSPITYCSTEDLIDELRRRLALVDASSGTEGEPIDDDAEVAQGPGTVE